jgi:heme o synthase
MRINRLLYGNPIEPMKAIATVQTIAAAAVPGRNWLAIGAELFKARLTGLVLMTTLVGSYMATQGQIDYVLLLHTILGTALLAGGAAALNQLWERDYDARMRRTRNRPLPAGELQPRSVLWIGSALAITGLAELAIKVNWVTTILGACTVAIYLLLYTPLKRVSWLNTVVGAIPGALPPVMGWTAVRGHLSAEAGALFGILVLWQLPHFMAIAWIYREDYAQAGFKMLSVVDPSGRRTARLALFCALALLLFSVTPWFLGMAGPVYLAASLLMGTLFLAAAVGFARRISLSRARQLFLASILYLPLLLAAMVVARTQ